MRAHFFSPRSPRAQKRLSLSLQLSSTFKACFVTTALRQYYPRLLIHYYFEHRVKVNLVSLDAVTHFVTHCLLCTDRHFIFKYSACHFHDTKRSAHFFMTRTRAVPDADLPLEFHEPPASPDPSPGASDSTLSTPSSSPLSSPSTSPGSSPGRSEWRVEPADSFVRNQRGRRKRLLRPLRGRRRGGVPGYATSDRKTTGEVIASAAFLHRLSGCSTCGGRASHTRRGPTA